ncbi:MAG: hypothetical protein K6B68_16820 [Eubacterium sp.]|nr:hypothetical protein [Eubacterium sp.]
MEKALTTSIGMNVVADDSNSLAALFPNIAKEWHPTKNETSPDKIKAHSNINVWWSCAKCGYEWQTRLNNRVNQQSGCPLCSYEMHKNVGNICFDHKNIQYASVAEMCKTYGVNKGTYLSRIKRGWSVKEALTAPSKPLKVKKNPYAIKDHNGKEYNTLTDMLNAYNIPYSVYKKREKIGMPLKEILTVSIDKGGTPVQDPFCPEKWFSSKNALYKHYGVDAKLVSSRMKELNWSFEKAIKTPRNEPGKTGHNIKCIDKNGTTFNSRREMYAHYGVSSKVMHYRKKTGMNEDKALYTPLYETVPESSSKLTQMVINYIKENGDTKYKLKYEVRFDGLYSCTSKKDNATKSNLLRFDIGLFLNDTPRLLIEIDGYQHFVVTDPWYSESLKKNDQIKNDFCRQNSIPLLRIKYNIDGTFDTKKTEELLSKCLETLNLNKKPSIDYLDLESRIGPIEVVNKTNRSNPISTYNTYMMKFQNNIKTPDII